MAKPLFAGEFIAFSPFDRVALAELIRSVARPGCRMAKVGSWLGNGSTQVFLEQLAVRANSSLLCVDTWCGNSNIQRHQEIVAAYDVFGTFRANVAEANRPEVKVCAMVASSLDTAQMVADEAFDLVFIDADHRYGAVLADVAAWLPKVRGGDSMRTRLRDSAAPRNGGTDSCKSESRCDLG